jgi:hypothetical protein
MTLPERWLAVDPGEDTGWSVWEKGDFVDGSTTKMWTFGDAVWYEAFRQLGLELPGSLDGPTETEQLLHGITRIVCEDWRLYPWVLKTGAMDFDECRTARLIGSLYQACRIAGWEWFAQPAKAKGPSAAAGAEAFFVYPLRENRHQNDSALAGWYHVVMHDSDDYAAALPLMVDG